jgi:hypothetical protein
MTTHWKNWLSAWCAAIILFGAVLAAGAFPATDAACRFILELMRGSPGGQSVWTDELRFTAGLTGAVTLGWGMTLALLISAGHQLASAAFWRSLVGVMAIWYVVDSAVSISTGFALNAVSNTVFVIGLMIPLLASGVLHRPASARA